MSPTFDSVVFTLDSLKRCMTAGVESDWYRTFEVPEDGSWGVLRVVRGKHCFVLDEKAGTPRARIVIRLAGVFDTLRKPGWSAAMQRIHRIGVQASRRQLAFPHAWSQYTADNYITVFAYQLTIGSERIIAEIVSGEAPDVYVCKVTTADHPVDLTGFASDRAVYTAATREYGEAAREIASTFGSLAKRDEPGVVDLEAAGFGAVTGGRNYNAWMPLLTLQQRDFLDRSCDRSLKLRGPAGAGKTLAMEMKALRTVYDAADSGRRSRVLYVTHSWSVAEQVQDGLERLDERGVLQAIDVFPLLTLAEGATQSAGGSAVRILGDDSFAGKEAQLSALAALMAEARRGAWLTFRSMCSAGFQNRVEAAPRSIEANRLLWDLMLEFSCVIGAAGILPGLNALPRYKKIERRPWMLPLDADAEKDFVFHIYDRFVRQLVERHEMTTDQLINDYLSYLATYRWHSERAASGYDVIFVDEFHLFNEQERMVFHHLTASPDVPPVIIMALDPRQSPAESYAQFAVPDATLRESGEADETLGGYANIDLNLVFRYTPEIHEFLAHLDRFYPALELGEDWGIGVSKARPQREHGDVPVFVLHGSSKEEIRGALNDARELAGTGNRVAILCLDGASFEEFKSAAAAEKKGRFAVVESRDETESLRYSSASIVVSQPHYVAGLQFDAVVIGGCRPEFSQYDPHQAYGLRRFLSDLYLGASRARDVLHIHASGERGEFPAVIETALDEDILRVP